MKIEMPKRGPLLLRKLSRTKSAPGMMNIHHWGCVFTAMKNQTTIAKLSRAKYLRSCQLRASLVFYYSGISSAGDASH